jgi:hypothetical protein
MKHEYTSEEIASFASRGLRLGKDALTDAQFRSVCGTALTQAAPKQAPQPSLAAFAPPGAHAYYSGLLRPYQGQTLEGALKAMLVGAMKPYTGPILGDDKPRSILDD